ncbi:hypothetical protein ACRALDRAFT_2107868 [Sodiomyces alcalophilus JCM 7366]|uniref:uncharacterized protein n=1 Tax=Sodiomyces alcalophilus JCM 7366 TaxID=591952 RepID=UPI0039B58E62
MEVSNPKRILVVSAEGQVEHLSRVIKDLTGSHPEPTSSTSAGPTLAGTTHPLLLKTAYYTATVPIWLDLIPDNDPADWASAFLTPEAREVLGVLGGVAVVFPVSTPATTDAADPSREDQNDGKDGSSARHLIREVGRVVREGLGGWEWDGVGLAIGVGGGADVDHEKIADAWEDVCGEAGLEFVLVRGQERDQGRNEFGEKMGIPRVLEALESNDWAHDPSTADMEDDPHEDPEEAKTKPRHAADDDDDEFNLENLDFAFDAADFEGLKKAIWGLDSETDGNDSPGGSGAPTAGKGDASASREEEIFNEELEVEKIEAMMRKLQAVRDMSAGLPEDQKRRMAAKAVAEVMKDL